jgi:transposase
MVVIIMSKRYPAEVREKAVRLALERLDEIESPYTAVKVIGPIVDVHHKTCHLAVKVVDSRGIARRAMTTTAASSRPTS